MIVTSADTITQYAKISNILDFDAIKADVYLVEQNQILPLISKPIFTEMESTNLTGVKLELQKLCFHAISNLAIYNYLDKARVNVSSDGVTSNFKKEASKAAEEWAMYNAKESYLTAGNLFLEAILTFLEENISDFDDWKSSANYTLLKDTLLYSTNQFDTYVRINGSRKLFLALMPFIRRVEKSTAPALLTKDFYTSLIDKNKVEPDSFTDKEKVIIQYIQEIVALISMAHAIQTLRLNLDDNGFFILETNKTATVKGRTATTAIDLQSLASTYLSDAELIKSQLAEYLSSENITGYTAPASAKPVDQTGKTIYIF